MDWKAKREHSTKATTRKTQIPASSYAKAAAHKASDRVILHIDLDSFYAQAVCNLFPELHERPIGIKQKNIVVTCNYIARVQGVSKLQYLQDAFKACPELILVSGENLLQFRRASEAVFRSARGFLGPLVAIERLGMDELFVDVAQLLSDTTHAGVEHPTADADSSSCMLRDWTRNSAHRRDWCGHVICAGASNVWRAQSTPSSSLGSTPSMSPRVGTCAPPPSAGTAQYPLVQLSASTNGPSCALGTTVCVCESGGSLPVLSSGCASTDYERCASSCDTSCLGRVDPSAPHVVQTLHQLRRASWLLAGLRCVLRERLGITASGGVGTSKLAAKLASSVCKPNGQTIMLPWSLPAFMRNIPLRSVPGVGYALRQQLKAKNLFFVEDVRVFPLAALQAELGSEVGAFLHGVCWAQDTSPVQQQAHPKSVSCEDAFQRCSSAADALVRLRGIVRSWLVLLDNDANQHHRRPGVLRLSWRQAGTARQSKQAAFPDSVPLGGTDTALSPEQHWLDAMAGSAQRTVANSPKDERGALLLSCGGSSQVDDGDARLSLLMQVLHGLLRSALAEDTLAARAGRVHLTLLGVAACSFSPLAGSSPGKRHSLNLRSMLVAQRAAAGGGAAPRIMPPAAAGAAAAPPAQQQPHTRDHTSQASSGVPSALASQGARAGGNKRPREAAGTAVEGGDKRSREAAGTAHSDVPCAPSRPRGVTPEAWSKLPLSVQQAIAAVAPVMQ